MVKAYKVAHHVFHLELPDSSSIWAQLGQYDQFEVAPVEEPVFTLRLNQGAEFPEDLRTVYDVPTEAGETVVKLYRSGDGRWVVEMAPTSEHPISGRTLAAPDFKSAELCIKSRRMSDAVFSINNSLMLLFAFTTASMGTLELHASVIRNNGKGYLFLAKSGTGKSTHSQLWLDHIPGSDLLNDDNPIVRIWPDGSTIVYGSPWSGKTPCYRNIECPVGAFVRIRRCAENRITRLQPIEAYALLYSSCSGFKADPSMADGLHESLEGAVFGAPSFVLDCRPDEEAARVCHAGVTEEANV